MEARHSRLLASLQPAVTYSRRNVDGGVLVIEIRLPLFSTHQPSHIKTINYGSNEGVLFFIHSSLPFMQLALSHFCSQCWEGIQRVTEGVCLSAKILDLNVRSNTIRPLPISYSIHSFENIFFFPFSTSHIHITYFTEFYFSCDYFLFHYFLTIMYFFLLFPLRVTFFLSLFFIPFCSFYIYFFPLSLSVSPY